jgi:hypothetical protein
MTHQQQLLEWTESIIEITEKWKDKKINVQISLTDRDFDRHGTTYTYFSMIFKSCFMRISGGRLMFDGTNNELVEIAVGDIITVDFLENNEKNEIIVLEKLGKNNLGHDIIRRVKLILKP